MAMLMMKERRPAFRTIEGWVRSVLLDAGAIRECEESCSDAFHHFVH
jgi:hypothetical protein